MTLKAKQSQKVGGTNRLINTLWDVKKILYTRNCHEIPGIIYLIIFNI